MFKWIIDWVFARENEVSDVKVHDFTERSVGHDLTLRGNAAAVEAEAVVTSLEKIQVGEVILTEIDGQEFNFSVLKSDEVAPMIFHVVLALLEVPYDDV